MKRRGFVLVVAGAIASSQSLGAQPKAFPVIGFLGSASAEAIAVGLVAFYQGLCEAGYIDGRNVAIEYRWAAGQYDSFPALAAELIGREVDVILVSGVNRAISAVKHATLTIPIVFVAGADVVEAGLVTSIARPGGNLTGISVFSRELNPKRLQLLTELIPQTEIVAVLVNPNGYSGSADTMRDMQEAARANGRRLTVVKAATETDLDTAFAIISALHAGGLVVAGDSFLNSRREKLVALAARYAVPAVYEYREFAEIGGLMTYGPNLAGTYRQAGLYVGRILAGAKPDSLPILQPTRFELVINLRTAKTLGLAIPPSILGRADELIE